MTVTVSSMRPSIFDITSVHFSFWRFVATAYHQSMLASSIIRENMHCMYSLADFVYFIPYVLNSQRLIRFNRRHCVLVFASVTKKQNLVMVCEIVCRMCKK